MPSLGNRTLEPEILDHLAPDDPVAVACRRDLRLINFFMGNHRWLRKEILATFPGKTSSEITIMEWGAGGGELWQGNWHSSRIKPTAFELHPPPGEKPERLGWRTGRIPDDLPNEAFDAVVCNLFLHHFPDHDLKKLGDWCQRNTRHLWIVEPLRRRRHLWQMKALLPFGLQKVTRHDAAVSIRAGFLPGELSQQLGLGKEWAIEETSTFFGGLRWKGIRK